jgi:predicted ABC-type ATPase
LSWLTLVSSIVGAVFAGGGAAAVVNALARRRVVHVEAADRLNESTLEWAEQLKADAHGARIDASEARKEAADARREATEAHRQMRAVKTEAEEIASYLAVVVRWIQSPDMSMERLRALVNQSGPVNGMIRKD